MDFLTLSTHGGFTLTLGCPFALVLIVLIGFLFKKAELLPAILGAVRSWSPLGEHKAKHLEEPATDARGLENKLKGEEHRPRQARGRSQRDGT